MQLKPISEQVMVITGASSGIGLVTARMAAKRGARLVLTSRNSKALERLADEITTDPSSEGTATFLPADVADESALRRVAHIAASRFGRIDTWVNGAGVSAYGRVTDVSWEDQRRLFETNFWGVVAGSRVAVEHMRHEGGALINIGSTSSDCAVPLQGIYSASKHALKAYTDALRMEVEHDGLPLSVTLVKPYAVDPLYAVDAKHYLPDEPASRPPVYEPEVVAQTILHCAEHPVRDAFAGGDGKPVSVLGSVASSLRERGRQASSVCESSLYSRVSLHPMLTSAALAATGLTMASYVHRRRNAAAAWRKGRAGRDYLAYPW